jgi:Na+-transporting NADH:ubiquinone oxidoreductase subunit B
MKQKPHRRVIACLVAVAVAAVFFFGWRAAVVVATGVIVCYLTEALYAWVYRQPISEAVFVTGLLVGLILPPTIPIYMVVLAGVFGTFFGKMVFGGFGRNIFNPAMTGRCFLYISFGKFMTGPVWYPSFFQWDGSLGNFFSALGRSFPGGFAHWARYDAITAATPLVWQSWRGEAFGLADYLPMMFGSRGGSIGETFTVLIVLCGLYLMWKKTADWRLTVGTLTGVFGTAFLYWLAGHAKFPTPFNPLIGGSTMFVAVFMVTDPISAAKTKPGKWIFSVLVGVLLVLIRTHSIWVAGAMFSVLLGNMFVPLIDYCVNAVKNRHKEKEARTIEA